MAVRHVLCQPLDRSEHACWAAAAQVCARSSKFSLFDPAKEMAYIQMSRAEKSKGKAAVDLIGSQVGGRG